MPAQPATLPGPAPGDRAVSCPSDDDLLAFLPGELSGPLADSIALHLATCRICQTRITTLKQRLSDRQNVAGSISAGGGLPGGAVGRVADSSDSPTTLLQELRPRVPRRLNEYELLQPIGRGGMGLVYRARHTRLQRTVAVKVLPHLSLADESAVIRMQRESAAAGRVRHANIVYATDAGECDGIDYLVMDYIEGADLSKLVAVLGPLAVADACEIIRQAALGLEHIAGCGLVHRDLKPSNLMLADDGTVKILDLGLARLHFGQVDDAEATQAGYLLGTADYVAPEQIDSPHDADVRSDLYSLGCTFYKLLAGRAPFGGEEFSSVHRKVEAHRHTPPPPIRDLLPDLPEEVAELVARLLAKRPEDRFQHPQELAEALVPHAARADLSLLVRRLRERSDLDGLPLPTPSRTPLSPDATTKPLGDAATPPPLALARRTGTAIYALAGVLICVALVVALVVVPPWPSGPSTGGSSPRVPATPTAMAPPEGTADLHKGAAPPTAPALKSRGDGNPLFSAAKAVEQPTLKRDLQTFFVDPENQMMQLVAPKEPQLVQLGDIQPSKGRISLELEMLGGTGGDAGIYLGLKQRMDGSRRWTEAHFIHFQMEYAQGDKPFWFAREQGAIWPGNNALTATVARRARLSPRRSQRFKLEVGFTPEGIQEIKLDDKPFPEMLQTSYSQQFDPQSIWGPWGLFNHGSTIHVFQPTLIQEPQRDLHRQEPAASNLRPGDK